MNGRIRVLVLCTGNRCRSQMAEGWLRHLSGGDVEVHSAGTRPSVVHPLAVKVMAEAGVDVSGQRSKHVDEYAGQSFDYVITVCDSAKEACPVFPGNVRTVHHSFPDPDAAKGSDEEVIAVFRDVRDRVRDWCWGFLQQLRAEV